MRIQDIALLGLKKLTDYNLIPNKRVKIDVGLKCNYNCIFCYYKNHLKENFFSFNIIKEKIFNLYQIGFNDFDLSGGEPTLHPKFFDILSYIKSLNCKISCVSNGFKFADLNFCKKCKEFDLNEVLFSLHATRNTHNYITGNKYSFDNCIKGIENCQSLNYKIRINCTLCDINYKELNDYVKIINQLNPFELNFILLNYNDDQLNYKKVDLLSICNKLNQIIPKINPNIDVRVRYVPYCYINDKNKIYNYYDHIFDLYDWNLVYSYTNCKEKFKNNKDLIQKNIDFLPAIFTKYVKKPQCMQCKFFYICDGLKNNDSHLNVFPIPGKKVVNFKK